METPTPRSSSAPSPPQRLAAQESQIRAWLALRRELAELHARLEYLKLLVNLGVGKTKG